MRVVWERLGIFKSLYFRRTFFRNRACIAQPVEGDTHCFWKVSDASWMAFVEAASKSERMCLGSETRSCLS